MKCTFPLRLIRTCTAQQPQFCITLGIPSWFGRRHGLALVWFVVVFFLLFLFLGPLPLLRAMHARPWCGVYSHQTNDSLLYSILIALLHATKDRVSDRAARHSCPQTPPRTAWGPLPDTGLAEGNLPQRARSPRHASCRASSELARPSALHCAARLAAAVESSRARLANQLENRPTACLVCG